MTAELSKLTENAYRDVNLAFANEIANVAEHLGVDPWELISIANLHPRVSILNPGPGVGGHCIAVDPWFIASAAPAQSPLIQTARRVNDSRPEAIVRTVLDTLGDRAAPRIAALGLSFKADIDDLRESPAREIVKRLSHLVPTAHIRVVEPHISTLPSDLASTANVELSQLLEATEDADLILLLVDHAQFRDLDVTDLRLNGAALIDTRGIWR